MRIDGGTYYNIKIGNTGTKNLMKI